MGHLGLALAGLLFVVGCAAGDKIVPAPVSLNEGEPPPPRVAMPSLGEDLQYRIYVAEGQYWLTHGNFDRAAEEFNSAIALRPDGAEGLKGIQLAVASKNPKTVFPVTDEDTTGLARKLLFLSAQAKKRGEWTFAIGYAKPVAFEMHFPPEHEQMRDEAQAALVEAADGLLHAQAHQRESYCALFQFQWPAAAYEAVNGCTAPKRSNASEPEPEATPPLKIDMD